MANKILDEDELLFTSCKYLAKKQSISLVKPSEQLNAANIDDYMQGIAQSSGIRIRKVALPAQWWKRDCGLILGFYHGKPGMLLPKKRGGYYLKLLNPQQSIRVSPQIAAEISTHGYCFYRSLPENIFGIKDLLKFSFQSLKADLMGFIGTEVMLGLLALTVPIVIGILFIRILPDADITLFWQIIILLFVNILVMTIFDVSRAIHLIRMRFKLEAIITPAVWDRILQLPMEIFRRFSTGDLSLRAEIITDVQNTLTQSTLVSIANGLVSLLILGLLFYLNMFLAIVACALAVLIALFNFFINLRQLHFMRRFYFHFGKLITFIYEILTGIEKLRVANAVPRIFKGWSDRLQKRTAAELAVKSFLLRQEVFLAIMLIFNPLLLYSLVYLIKSRISFGVFMAFDAAYLLFFSTILKMSADVSEAVRILPLWKRAKVLMTTRTEKKSGLSDPGLLTGKIELKDVVFRYHHYEKPLFENFSLHINPGEFIAIVGPSGSGKSTLFRLLLGFEEPESGSIFFDEKNLKDLQLSAVRRQIGVVTQNSTLIPGTIYANIAGSGLQLSRPEAWEIAEKVGLTELIKLLPMQMDTLIGEGPITLSGGEVQRLVLARALAQKPKILLLDEATSALDNTTQAIVHHYLKELQITQLVAAHRLSTIVNAHKIYVLESGQIVQSGAFHRLINEPGLFSQLAKRQL